MFHVKHFKSAPAMMFHVKHFSFPVNKYLFYYPSITSAAFFQEFLIFSDTDQVLHLFF